MGLKTRKRIVIKDLIVSLKVMLKTFAYFII